MVNPLEIHRSKTAFLTASQSPSFSFNPTAFSLLAPYFYYLLYIQYNFIVHHFHSLFHISISTPVISHLSSSLRYDIFFSLPIISILLMSLHSLSLSASFSNLDDDKYDDNESHRMRIHWTNELLTFVFALLTFIFFLLSPSISLSPSLSLPLWQRSTLSCIMSLDGSRNVHIFHVCKNENSFNCHSSSSSSNISSSLNFSIIIIMISSGFRIQWNVSLCKLFHYFLSLSLFLAIFQWRISFIPQPIVLTLRYCKYF